MNVDRPARPMCMLHRRAAAVALLAIVLAGLLVACGDGSSGTKPAGGRQEGRTPKDGDTVSVHYTGTLDDGTQFDSSRGREPLKFTVGQGQVIAGFDKAVRNLSVGKSTKVHIDAKDAYGERRPELVRSFPAAQAPAGLQVGQRVAIGSNAAVVTAITPETVTVDANHELAGKALNFEIELVSIQ